jgi:hypothetical protein
MSTGYEPNIEGALAVLVDLMMANAFTMTRQPYEPNYRGLVDALIDLKEGFPVYAPTRVGFDAMTFEPVTDGSALYMRVSDGKVGLARMDGVVDEALVVGFADAAANTGETVKVIVTGMKIMPFAVDPGDLYFLSTNGAISTTPPTLAGQFVTRVGEGATVTEFSIQLEPPIELS